MNARGKFTDEYDEARRILKEGWRDSEGVVTCPECRMEAIDWGVMESEINSLLCQCEYCGETDWMYFDGDVPWES